jgi:hypothetical protein
VRTECLGMAKSLHAIRVCIRRAVQADHMHMHMLCVRTQ